MPSFQKISALICALLPLSNAVYIESYANPGKYLVVDNSTTVSAQALKTANPNADLSFEIAKYSNSREYVGCAIAMMPLQKTFNPVTSRSTSQTVKLAVSSCTQQVSVQGLTFVSVDKNGNCYGADALPARVINRYDVFKDELCIFDYDKYLMYKVGYKQFAPTLDNVEEMNVMKNLRSKQTKISVDGQTEFLIRRSQLYTGNSGTTLISLQSKKDSNFFLVVENGLARVKKFEDTNAFKDKATFAIRDKIGGSKMTVKGRLADWNVGTLSATFAVFTTSSKGFPLW